MPFSVRPDLTGQEGAVHQDASAFHGIMIRFLITLSHTGISFREAIHVLFDIPYKIDGYYMSFEAVALGIVIGLVWFFRRRKRKRIMGKEAESDQSSEVPGAGQKEEWTEPPRSMSR